MKIIKLHGLVGVDSEKEQKMTLYFNMNNIVGWHVSVNHEGFTILYTEDGKAFFVEETPEAIELLMRRG